MFQVVSKFQPIDEQIKAADALAEGFLSGEKNQVLLGVTGSGKTFTMAQVIQKLNIPTLVISHNKTLAGQLYQEMRDFFPNNAVSYFVSYYDYYQPEAYIPQTDTYIEKEAEINEVIDKLRLGATSNLLTRTDVIVVASVSCIYNIGSPVEYGRYILDVSIGQEISVKEISTRLVSLQYDRSPYDFHRGTFRIRGDMVDVYPAYEDVAIRIKLSDGRISSLSHFDPLTGTPHTQNDNVSKAVVYPAKHYMTDPAVVKSVEGQIMADLTSEVAEHRKKGHIVEAERLSRKVTYDLEMIREMGYVNGIENYSRYFDGRTPGQPPYSLLNYFSHRFGQNWLCVVDESHMTIPQIRGMYNGDRSRKETLIDYGFRLRSALDNRPLMFDEFYKQVPHFIHASATPADWELEKAKKHVAQLLVRPTGIVDPPVSVRDAEGEIADLTIEIKKRVAKKERVLVTALTKRIAEDLTAHLKEKGINADYLHSDIKTLERTHVLNQLRKGEVDVLVGINLLREGLDLPEVSLVAILDADNEGFLRSKTALIQTMGRAARNTEGQIIIYTHRMTDSIKGALSEAKRRREYQLQYNKTHSISPKTIYKKIREQILNEDEVVVDESQTDVFEYLEGIDNESLTPYDRKKLIAQLQKSMRKEVKDLHFEAAIAIRDKIAQLENS